MQAHVTHTVAQKGQGFTFIINVQTFDVRFDLIQALKQKLNKSSESTDVQVSSPFIKTRLGLNCFFVAPCSQRNETEKDERRLKITEKSRGKGKREEIKEKKGWQEK